MRFRLVIDKTAEVSPFNLRRWGRGGPIPRDNTFIPLYRAGSIGNVADTPGTVQRNECIIP
ncbi:MAG TPA: hypothetical protein VLX12_07235, partial [Syntrophorhabdales bacterium]|nr:hypothetical protein [Syntrophorhabdales bacterium]